MEQKELHSEGFFDNVLSILAGFAGFCLGWVVGTFTILIFLGTIQSVLHREFGATWLLFAVLAGIVGIGTGIYLGVLFVKILRKKLGIKENPGLLSGRKPLILNKKFGVIFIYIIVGILVCLSIADTQARKKANSKIAPPESRLTPLANH